MIVTTTLDNNKALRETFRARLGIALKAKGYPATRASVMAGLKEWEAQEMVRFGFPPERLEAMIALATTLDCGVDWLLGMEPRWPGSGSLKILMALWEDLSQFERELVLDFARTLAHS